MFPMRLAVSLPSSCTQLVPKTPQSSTPGSRTIEDLANFVKESGKYKIDAYVEDTVMEDADQDTMIKAAPAATVSEEASGAAESIKSAVSKAAEAAKTVVGDTDEDMGDHDEL